MGLLYDVTYYHGNHRTKDFDRDMPVDALRAPKGHLARCSCTNGEREVFWVNDKGEVVPAPTWAKE